VQGVRCVDALQAQRLKSLLAVAAALDLKEQRLMAAVTLALALGRWSGTQHLDLLKQTVDLVVIALLFFEPRALIPGRVI
jgi:hypothetical protein